MRVFFYCTFEYYNSGRHSLGVFTVDLLFSTIYLVKKSSYGLT